MNVTLEELIGDGGTPEGAVNARKIVPYFKPLLTKHESGFRHMEVGYCEISGPRQTILQTGTDHVCWMEPLLSHCRGKTTQQSLNMDVDECGRIRIYRGFTWSDPPLSTALLEYTGTGKDQ